MVVLPVGSQRTRPVHLGLVGEVSLAEVVEVLAVGVDDVQAVLQGDVVVVLLRVLLEVRVNTLSVDPLSCLLNILKIRAPNLLVLVEVGSALNT